MSTRCNFRFELMNGETVTPCHKERGHLGEHEGYCLGSRAVWESSEPVCSEEDEYRRVYIQEDVNDISV